MNTLVEIIPTLSLILLATYYLSFNKTWPFWGALVSLVIPLLGALVFKFLGVSILINLGTITILLAPIFHQFQIRKEVTNPTLKFLTLSVPLAFGIIHFLRFGHIPGGMYLESLSIIPISLGIYLMLRLKEDCIYPLQIMIGILVLDFISYFF